MITNSFFKISAAVFALATATLTVSAQGLIFNNFGTGSPAWNTSPGPDNGGMVAAADSFYGTTASVGQLFTPDASGTLASFSLAMIGNVYATTSVRPKVIGNADTSPTVTFSLYSWDDFALGTTALESWTVAIVNDGTSTEITLTSSVQPQLLFGQSYALVATAGSGVWAEWDDSLVSGATGDLGQLALTNGRYAPGGNPLALQVYAMPVPEPGTLALVGLGVAGLWRRRRKSAA